MDDLISRQAAIDALNEVSENYTEKGREWHPHVNFMIDAIKELPVVHRRGKWSQKCDEEGYLMGNECSECHKKYVMPDGWANFCPNCGADMRSEE